MRLLLWWLEKRDYFLWCRRPWRAGLVVSYEVVLPSHAPDHWSLDILLLCGGYLCLSCPVTLSAGACAFCAAAVPALILISQANFHSWKERPVEMTLLTRNVSSLVISYMSCCFVAKTCIQIKSSIALSLHAGRVVLHCAVWRLLRTWNLTGLLSELGRAAGVGLWCLTDRAWPSCGQAGCQLVFLHLSMRSMCGCAPSIAWLIWVSVYAVAKAGLAGTGCTIQASHH